ncbi:MAG: carboxypeptidase-like regulatory domain-containing protein [Rhizobacter sp.]|nr:carboxypeptidase-like regulatory domain-containing protein [Chlorobiales bacterium]
MKTLVLILLALLLSHDMFAQDSARTGVIIGKVIDRETREPLIGAALRIEGTRLGGTTKISGDFKIVNVPFGKCVLKG